MQTKLTLRLDKKLIAIAKAYSERSGKSVSQLVADYFALINEKQATNDNDHELMPITRSLKGSLSGKKVNEKDYHKYLEDKYL